jgi:hypothetical protein
MRLQALIRHWLAAALQDDQLRQISLRVQVWAQQQMQQIISVEVRTQRHALVDRKLPCQPRPASRQQRLCHLP